MKRTWSILCISILCLSSSLRAISHLEYATLSVAACTTTWALIERYKKNERTKMADALAKELQDHKNEAKQLAADKEVLSTWNERLKNRSLEYDASGDFLASTPWLKEEIGKAGSCYKYSRKLEEDVETFHKGVSILQVKMAYWQEHRPEFLEEGKLLLEKCQAFVNLLVSIKQYFDSERYSIELELLYDASKVQHKKELGLVHDHGFNHGELGRLVKEKYPKSRFPFIEYAQHIKEAKQEIEGLIEKCKKQESANKNRTIHLAQDLLRVYEELYTTVVFLDEYKQEAREKPIYEAQEARKKREIAEREARIASELREKELKAQAEKCSAESQLCAERARELEEANRASAADLECRRTALRTEEVQLERIRIQEREAIKKAVDEKDRDWKQRYDALQSEIHSLKNGRNLETVKSELSQLHDALDVPPYVPGDAQQGINNYIHLLKRHLNNARTALR